MDSSDGNTCGPRANILAVKSLGIKRALVIGVMAGIGGANRVGGRTGIAKGRCSVSLSGGRSRGRVGIPRAISMSMVGSMGVSGPGCKSLIR